jgi:hypothetical protein
MIHLMKIYPYGIHYRQQICHICFVMQMLLMVIYHHWMLRKFIDATGFNQKNSKLIDFF